MTFSTPSWEADHPLFEREDKGELRIELKRKKEGAYIGTLVATRGGPSRTSRRAFKSYLKRALKKNFNRDFKEGHQ